MKPLIEIFIYLSVVATTIALDAIGIVSLNACVWIATILLVGLLILAWRRFDGGRHPCFLFLAMLLIFQGGRLVGAACGVVNYPMQLDVSTVIPLDVSVESAKITLLIIALSALCIYAPCRFVYQPNTCSALQKPEWLRGLYFLIVITFPFAVFKNAMYLLYVRSHGGYLAVFTDNAGVLQSAGTIPRVISIICTTALLIAFALEKRRRPALIVLLVFVGLSLLDLLIGFRGKVLSEVLSLWLIHNLKTGKRFRLVPVLTAAVLMNLIAVAVAAYREDNRIMMLSPVGFLAAEGISMNVTEAAVEYHDRFAPHGFDYLTNGFLTGLFPVQSKDEGQLWTTDLTTYLNPTAQKLGFGTASSYLAELYLFGRIPAVIAGSLLIGFSLASLYRVSSGNAGMIVLALLLPALIYLPRLELLNPLAVLIKSLLVAIIVGAFVTAYLFAETLVAWKVLHSPQFRRAES